LQGDAVFDAWRKSFYLWCYYPRDPTVVSKLQFLLLFFGLVRVHLMHGRPLTASNLRFCGRFRRESVLASIWNRLPLESACSKTIAWNNFFHGKSHQERCLW
jgi:hypothetical protein